MRRQPFGVVSSTKINAFQKFVTEAAITIGAATLGEEMNDERMLVYGHNAITVAQLVARQLNIVHVFCEPNETERQALGLRGGDEMEQHAKTIAARTAGDWARCMTRKFGNNPLRVRPSGPSALHDTALKQIRWCSYAGPTIAQPSRKP